MQMMKEKASSKLFWCLFFTYSVHVVGKTSFAAATVALIDEGILTKTQAGLISGIFWLLYAVGQFAGGFIANRINPYVLIKSAIVISVASNFIMAFEKNFVLMLLTWGLSGLLQFGLWPSTLQIISTEIIGKQRGVAMERIGFCYGLGSIWSYLMTACLLNIVSYEYIFISCAAMTGISYFVMVYAQRNLSDILQEEDKEEEVPREKKGKFTWKIIWESGLVFFCVLIILRGILDTGIKNWMPTILMETYGATPSFTSLLSVFLLVTNMLGVIICCAIYNKMNHNELPTLRTVFFIIMPMMLLLLGFRNISIYMVTALMSGITILLYGSAQFITVNYSIRFHRYGLVAAVGGIVNCFAAVGNMIASYGSGYVADRLGWDTLIVIWNVVVVVFVAITILLIPIWKRFRIK